MYDKLCARCANLSSHLGLLGLLRIVFLQTLLLDPLGLLIDFLVIRAEEVNVIIILGLLLGRSCSWGRA